VTLRIGIHGGVQDGPHFDLAGQSERHRERLRRAWASRCARIVAHCAVAGRVTRKRWGKWLHFVLCDFAGGIDLAQLPSRLQKAARAVRLIEALVHLKRLA
jgi:hypothetical protein